MDYYSLVFYFLHWVAVTIALNLTTINPKRFNMLVTQTQTQKRTSWRIVGHLMPCWVDQEPVHRFQTNAALHLRRSTHHPREPLHHPPPPVSSRNRGWKKENRSTLLYYCKRQESAPLRTHLTKVTKKKPLCTQLPSCHGCWCNSSKKP